MMNRFLLALYLSLAFVAGASPVVARAEDRVQWPSDQSDRLEKVQAQSHALQQQLFAARLQANDDEARRITKQLKELQSQEVELLRATGQLPR